MTLVRFRAWKLGEEDSEDKHGVVMDIARDALGYLQPHLRNLLVRMEFFSVFK